MLLVTNFKYMPHVTSNMEKQILEIVKGKDEYKFSVEVTNANSKFEPQITVKVRSDENLEETAHLAREVYETELKKLRGTT